MKLTEIFEKAIEAGIANDPRGRDNVLKELSQRAEDFEALKEKDREFFDMDSLKNPYSDSRLLTGTGQEEITSVLAGIDIDVGEVMLAEALGAKGRPVDLLLSHHPSGRAYANLYSVMHMQADILHSFGVPISTAEALTEGRAKEVERKLMPANHTRADDAARLMGFPFLCLHTPADNMVASHLQKLFDDKAPLRLSNAMDLLMEIPEYREAASNGTGPKILIGSEKRKTGKVFVDMTGGTGGSKDIFTSMASSGINTIMAMHLSEEHRKEAEKNHINVVIAGHISSDNLGLNLLFDEITRGHDLDIIECSGFRRVKRGQA